MTEDIADKPDIEAYVFDLFGTLVVSEKEIYRNIWDTHFESYHCVYRPKLMNFISSRNFSTLDETLDAMLFKLGMEFTDEQRDAFFSDLEKCKKKTKVAKGAHKLLKHLKDSGYKLALLSNQSPLIEDLLDRHDLAQYFDVIVQSHKVGMLKPEKQIYESTLSQLGVEPENALMVGDSLDHDHLDPKRLLGMQSVVYDPENRYPGYQHKVSSWKEFREKYVE